VSKRPKAELHVHLEGTIRPELGKLLAKRNNIPFPEHLLDSTKQFYESSDFLLFLKAYDEIAALIKRPIDYFDLTYDYLKQSAEVGVIYTEMMYSPDHAEKVSQIPSIEHLVAINEAINKAKIDFDIIGKIIITGVRHFGVEACEKVATHATEVDLPCVVGFGLGGDEIHYPPELFAKAYEIAAYGGLKKTIHAGEFGDAKSMQTAIKTCKVNRIGHGVAAILCPNTIAMLKDLNIPLEICPSSNIKLGLFPSIDKHPIKKLLELSVEISINSDDPPFMNTEIGREYDLVQKSFHLDNEEINNITRMAIKHAFIDDALKAKLLKKIEKG
jgi:adenosine deaminase